MSQRDLIVLTDAAHITCIVEKDRPIKLYEQHGRLVPKEPP